MTLNIITWILIIDNKNKSTSSIDNTIYKHQVIHIYLTLIIFQYITTKYNPKTTRKNNLKNRKIKKNQFLLSQMITQYVI